MSNIDENKIKMEGYLSPTVNISNSEDINLSSKAPSAEVKKNILEDVNSNFKKEVKDELKETKNQYIQIFGVFASIITLVGFNTVSAQKDIISIIIGNFFLGFFLIGFIWLLYLVPKLMEKENYIVKIGDYFSELYRNVFIALIMLIVLCIFTVEILLIFLGFAFFKDDFNFGLCNLYTLGEIKISNKVYCVTKIENPKPQTQFINNQNLK
jgi:hypothetical protein